MNAQPSRSKAAVASLITGLLGLACICGAPLMIGLAANNNLSESTGFLLLILGPVVGLLLSVVAFILGIVGIVQTGKSGRTGRGMAIFG